MQFWEYKVLTGAVTTIENDCNKLGRETWEAVGVTPMPGGKVAVLLKREPVSTRTTASVKVATRNTGPYVPGAPAGTEDVGR